MDVIMNAMNTVADQQVAPWQDKETSSLAKFAATVAAIVLVFWIAGCALALLLDLMAIIQPEPGSAALGASVLSLLGLGVVLAVSILALIKLYPYATRPAKFQLRNGILPADAVSSDFDVRFMRAGGRTFGGKGYARFSDTGLVVSGTMPPTVATQLLVIVCVTVIPLVVLGIGLGIIPALVLAYYIGRSEMSVSLSYPQTALSVKGRTATISAQGYTPQKIKFRIATTDGERFYNALRKNYPHALIGQA
jgi:hypothetical protein